MGSSIKMGTELALSMLRALPRVSLGNLVSSKKHLKKHKRGRGDHGGNRHGHGQKGGHQRQRYSPLGFESGNTPFYVRFPDEPYYQRHHLRRQYPPVSLGTLQLMIDTDRLDISKPIDLAAICNTGLYDIDPSTKEYGVHLTDEGADKFKAKVNIEVQWAKESVIAAVERNGGVITTAFFDVESLGILRNPLKFFEKGLAIPRRMLPPQDAILFYTGALNRGYLADPEQVSWERLVLAQKYGYKLPVIEDDADYKMLTERKDPRQILYGLEPGWVISLKDKAILIPKDEELREFYKI